MQYNESRLRQREKDEGQANQRITRLTGSAARNQINLIMQVDDDNSSSNNDKLAGHRRKKPCDECIDDTSEARGQLSKSRHRQRMSSMHSSATTCGRKTRLWSRILGSRRGSRPKYSSNWYLLASTIIGLLVSGGAYSQSSNNSNQVKPQHQPFSNAQTLSSSQPLDSPATVLKNNKDHSSDSSATSTPMISSSSLNLINVDQSIGRSKFSQTASAQSSPAPPPPTETPLSAADNTMAHPPLSGGFVGLESSSAEQQPSAGSSNEPGASQIADEGATQARDADSSSAQFYANSMDANLYEEMQKHQSIEQQQQQSPLSTGLISMGPGELVNSDVTNSDSAPVHHQKPSQHPLQLAVERRFGLFKKHGAGGSGGQYGSPITSANYAATASYVSDCERCLAGLGSAQQSAADLQQLEPAPIVPPVAPPSVAPSTIMHSHLQSFGQPFAPIKNKLLMKFPFFVKPISFGGGPAGDPYGSSNLAASAAAGPNQLHHSQSYAWHSVPHIYQPISSRPANGAALFLRPTAPAYNCIQSSPPSPSQHLYAAASSTNQEAIQVPGAHLTSVIVPSSPSKTGRSKTSHSHQQQQQQLHHSAEPFQAIHQQNTYASSQY